MGFFSRKKAEEPVVQNTPSKPQVDAAKNPAAVFDADAYFKSQESRSVKGPKSIKENTIRQKVEEMEKELAQKPEELDYKAYDKNPVREKELVRASVKLEEICTEVQEKESRTRYKAIRNAVETDMDKKVEELADKYDYLSDEHYNRNKNEFAEVKDDELFRSAQEYDMEAAEKREKVKNIMPNLSAQQLAKMEEFSQSDIKAKPIDLPDKIPTLSTDMLDKLTRQFEEKYGSLKEAAEKEEQKRLEEEKAAQQDEEELRRLREMFG